MPSCSVNTNYAHHHKTTFTDAAKQKGYLLGMVASYFFYKAIGFLGVIEKQTQVYLLHVGLLCVELLILFLILRAFRLQ